MMEAMPFTGPFQLTARVDADRQRRDAEPGRPPGRDRERVAPGASDIELVIDEVL